MKNMDDPGQKIRKCINNIVREIAVWKHLQEFGGNDPFWADGCNMNLTRNHILSYKREIREICEENNLALPEEYYLPTPPEVPNQYMSDGADQRRVERFRKMGKHLVYGKIEYDDSQLCF